MPDEVEIERCTGPLEAGHDGPIVLSRSGDARLIRLRGAMDIGLAAELKSVLNAAFDNAKSIRISCEGISDLDVTVLQLLWAAKQKAERANVEFDFSGEAPDALRTALEDLGMEDLELFL